MKAKVLIIVLLISAGLALTSCTSSRSGCRATEGYV